MSHNKVIANSYTFYHGTSESGATAVLTETIHYNFDKDKGLLTLTAAGSTAVGTDNVYGAYKWNKHFRNSQISSMIDANTSLIDSMLHMTYQNPAVVVREENVGKGAYYRTYSLDKFPKLPFIGQISYALTASATTATLYDTTGLMAGDYLTIEQEAMKVDSVDSSTQITVSRAQFDSSAVLHAVDVYLCNYVIEICNSPLGTEPIWHLLSFRRNFEIDKITGNVQLLHVNAEDKDALASDLYPPQRIFNRCRVTYKYGAESVPEDIKILCILMTARKMYQSMIANALGRGTDGFKPEGMQMIDNEIKQITKQNIRLMMDGF